MITLRTAKPEDASKLLAIYTPYVLNTAVTFELEVPTKEEFAARIQSTLCNFPYLVAEDQGEILGYAYASAFKSRAAYDWAVETSIYVRDGFHGRGLGRMLYTELERLLKKQHIYSLNACITYPNDESIRFHEKMGYTLCAHFHESGYKMGMWRDIVWMEKHLTRENPPQSVIPFGELKGEEHS